MDHGNGLRVLAPVASGKRRGRPHPWVASWARADDGGVRNASYWDWIAEQLPPAPHWFLDHIAVRPLLDPARGHGHSTVTVMWTFEDIASGDYTVQARARIPGPRPWPTWREPPGACAAGVREPGGLEEHRRKEGTL